MFSYEDCIENFDLEYYRVKTRLNLNKEQALFHFQHMGYKNGMSTYSHLKTLGKFANYEIDEFKKNPDKIIDLSFGVNIYRFRQEYFGLGHAAKLLEMYLSDIKIPFKVNLISDDYPVHIENIREIKHQYHINIICLNPSQIMEMTIRDEVFREILKKSYNIGYWFWECEYMPEIHRPAFDHFQEIWVASSFCQQLFSQHGTKPVQYYSIVPKKEDIISMPYENIKKKYGYKNDDFVFLSIFDFGSSMRRKNPHVAIDAFVEAFEHKENILSKDVKLFFKCQTINPKAEQIIKEYQDFLIYIENANRRFKTRRINILCKTVDKNELINIIRFCDVFVCLSSSEGQGLPAIEAIQLNKATIATNYSGFLDFMNNKNGILIDHDYQLVDDKTHYLLCYEQVWAKAKVNEAAKKFVEILDDNYRKSIERHASESFSKDTYEKTARKIFERLAIVYLKLNFPNDSIVTNKPSPVLEKMLKKETKEYFIDYDEYNHLMQPLLNFNLDQLKKFYFETGIKFANNWIICRSLLRIKICKLLLKLGFIFDGEFYIRNYSKYCNVKEKALEYYLKEGYRKGHIYVLKYNAN